MIFLWFFCDFFLVGWLFCLPPFWPHISLLSLSLPPLFSLLPFSLPSSPSPSPPLSFLQDRCSFGEWVIENEYCWRVCSLFPLSSLSLSLSLPLSYSLPLSPPLYFLFSFFLYFFFFRFAVQSNFGDIVAKLHAQSTITFFLGMCLGIPATFFFFFFFF